MTGAEVKTYLDGVQVTLKMPIGALEDVAKVNPELGNVLLGLGVNSHRLEEVRAIVDAGFKWGGVSGGFAEYFAEHGYGASIKLASDLMVAAWGPMGEDGAPGK